MNNLTSELKAKYDELRSKAQSECASMIEADSKGDKIGASAHRGQFVRLSNEADAIYPQIERARAIQFGGIE